MPEVRGRMPGNGARACLSAALAIDIFSSVEDGENIKIEQDLLIKGSPGKLVSFFRYYRAELISHVCAKSCSTSWI